METATYRSKGFITGSSLMWILIISQVSLFVMVPIFFFGFHPFIAMAAFMGALFLGFGLVTGEVTYTIDEGGLTKEVDPTMFKHFWRKKTFQYYPWDNIMSFKAGVDANRSYEEFQFLTIITAKGGKLELNDKKGDKASFTNFEKVFRQYVAAVEKGMVADPSKPVSARLEKEMGSEAPQEARTSILKHSIKEKPNFYQTTTAKALTILFILLSLALAGIVLTGGDLRMTNFFRLAFIIVPGTIYMYYRVFVKKE